ncbi:hypothetical protein [Streptomyces sp. NPDC001312]|uniref:hypothetical protein n=1 Tax=Streptomyces sp. NPDC001312 TaxID=3364561 RepID=UPI003698469C
MITGRVNAAKFIARELPEPHESDLGGELSHELLAAVWADWECPPSGHSLSWSDCYAAADQLPLTHKAALLLEPNGKPREIPAHLEGMRREQAKRARSVAVRIRLEAAHRGLY